MLCVVDLDGDEFDRCHTRIALSAVSSVASTSAIGDAPVTSLAVAVLLDAPTQRDGSRPRPHRQAAPMPQRASKGGPRGGVSPGKSNCRGQLIGMTLRSPIPSEPRVLTEWKNFKPG